MKQEPRLTQAPSQVYAAVGASLVVRDEAMAVPGRLRAALQGADRATDQLLTTAAQLAYEARERIVELPDQAASTPRRLLTRVRETVVDLRDGGQVAYQDFAASGERALRAVAGRAADQQAGDRVKRTVTPGVARATVSARAGQRQAAQSDTARRMRQFGQRVRSSLERNWEEYLAAVDETAPGGQGPARAGQRSGMGDGVDDKYRA